VDLPARLPDGTTTDRSVSKAVAQRDLDLGRDSRGNVAADLEAEAKIDAERRLSLEETTPRTPPREAGSLGGDQQ